MLRSLFSGISGLRANQEAMDVIGNNIANANTNGFKSSSIVFRDALAQQVTNGAAPTAGRGGTNALQVGLGVDVAATNANFGQGSIERTNRPTDLALQGDGLFVVERDNQVLYTRAGSFNFDSTGTLVAADGSRVQGYLLDATGAPTGGLVDMKLDDAVAVPAVPAGVTMLSYRIEADGKLSGMYSDNIRREMGQMAIANVTNPNGLERAGNTLFRLGNNTGAVTLGTAGDGRNGVITAGSLEMSNVDLASEFTHLIIAQRGFQASSRVVTTSDQVLEELVNLKR